MNSNLSSRISRLGVATLVSHIGKQTCERISSLGIALSPETLSDFLISDRGSSIFKSKELRFDLISTFDVKELRAAYNLKPEQTVNLEQLNNFTWGQNESSKEFLGLLGIDALYLEANDETSSPARVGIEIAKCLYPYQNWIRKGILEFLNDSDMKRLLIHMPTGAGKTRTALEAVCDYFRAPSKQSKLVIWMAHSDELCEQAIESFSALWQVLGTEKVDIFRMWGGRDVEDATFENPAFLVTSFQTAYNMTSTSKNTVFRTFANIRARASLLIVDEAHLSTAPTYQQAIESFSSSMTKTLGLTATPGRHRVGDDPKQTKKLSAFYGDNLLRIKSDEGLPLEDPIKYLTARKILSKVEHYELNSGTGVVLTDQEKRSISKRLDIPKSVLDRLGKDEHRTNLIVTHTLRFAVDYGFQTIVFAPSKINANEIAQLLRLKGCPAQSVVGDMHVIDRRNAIQQFKDGHLKVLVNFGVLTTGFDSPKIQAVVVARPTTSVVLYSQMVGRGLRGEAMGGTNVCHLLDVLDNISNMPDIGQAFNYFDEFYK